MVRVVSYIDSLAAWWPPTAIAASLGVPGYAVQNSNTVINLSFWTISSGPVDAALVWSNALNYVSPQNPWGTTNDQIQEAWIKLYHSAGVHVLVSAFGSTEQPTTMGSNPVTVATQLAQFVIKNHLDGVDLDWEDTPSFSNGTGENWLIACTQTLRQLLPANEGYIISHAPQAPYFSPGQYPSGAYLTVDKSVGNLIDYYNVQFYNQGGSQYSTFEALFQSSDGWATGTSVLEINKNGIQLNKIVIGKPVTLADVSNTGYVEVDTLAQILSQAVTQTNWSTGVMGWQFSSDKDGSWSTKLSNAIRKAETKPTSNKSSSSSSSSSFFPKTTKNFFFTIVDNEGKAKRIGIENITFDFLKKTTQNTFGLSVSPTKFWWIDDEGDICAIENGETFKETLRVIAKSPLSCSAIFFLNENNARSLLD